MTEAIAYQVPLDEQLASVPENARLVIDDPEGLGTRFIPVGRMSQEAAAELRRLHEAHDWQYKMAGERLRRIEKLEASNQELLKALTAICAKCRSNEWGPDTPRKEILNWMHDHASAAIHARGET